MYMYTVRCAAMCCDVIFVRSLYTSIPLSLSLPLSLSHPFSLSLPLSHLLFCMIECV